MVPSYMTYIFHLGPSHQLLLEVQNPSKKRDESILSGKPICLVGNLSTVYQTENGVKPELELSRYSSLVGI